jgi:hypothetical protein
MRKFIQIIMIIYMIGLNPKVQAQSTVIGNAGAGYLGWDNTGTNPTKLDIPPAAQDLQSCVSKHNVIQKPRHLTTI